MSGPVRPPLTVAESDGSPTIRPCNTISFNSADFVVIDNGATARIDLVPGGGAGASLANTLIGFGDAAGLLTGSANFTFTDESGGTGPTVLLTGDKPIIKIQDDSDPTDYRTELQQSGASLFIFAKNSGGGSVEMLRMDATYYAFQRGGSPNVGIGTVPASNVALHIVDDGTSDLVLLESTDAGAANAPDLVLFRNSASPAANDIIGQVVFRGKDSAAGDVDYFRVETTIIDPSSTSEDATMKIYGQRNNTEVEWVRYQGSGTVFNNAGNSNLDFSVFSSSFSTSTAFFTIDNGNQNVGIGGLPSATVERLEVVGDGSANPMVQFRSTETGSSASPHFALYRNNTGTANDDGGLIEFLWDNADDTKITGAQIYAEIQTATAGSEANRLRFYNMFAGSSKEWMRVSNNGIEINAFSDNIDFKIEGDATGHINFYSDASENNVGLGAVPANDVEALHITGTGTGDLVRLQTDEDGATVGPGIDFFRNSASPAVGDDLGLFTFSGNNSTGSKVDYAIMRVDIVDETAGTEDADFNFFIRKAGDDKLQFRIRQSEVVVNEDSVDCDFRVESDGNINMLRVDAALNMVSISGAPVSGGATLQVPDNTISSYCNIKAVRSDAVATQDFTNADCQGQLWVNDSATDWTLRLPIGAIKGMWFQFVSTNGQMDLDPQGTDTVNGSTSTFSRDTDYEIYTVVAYDTGKWLVTNPN